MGAETRSGTSRRRPALVALAVVTAALLGSAPSALAAAGGLDSGYGSAGFAKLGAGTALNAVAAEPDGSAIAVGTAGANTLVVKFDDKGSLDKSFGSGGVASIGAGELNAVAIQGDGGIVVAGDNCSQPTSFCGSGGMLVARLTDKGKPDSRFGSAGVLKTVPTGRVLGVGLGPNGTVVAAGDVRGADTFRRIAVIRLDSTGKLDNSFGSGGGAIVDLGQDSSAKSVAVQQDSKIVISGAVGPAAHQVVNAFAARLTSKGALDTSFGGASTPAGTNTPGVYWYFHPVSGANTTLNATVLDPAGGIAAAGWDTQDVRRQALFVRLTCAGKPQAGFGSGGVATLPSASLNSIGSPVGARGVGISGGDRVIGAGRYQDSGLAEIGVWGLNTNGAQAFFTSGPFTGDGAEGRGLAIDSSGRILVAGADLDLNGNAVDGLVGRYEGFGAAPKPSKAMCGGPPATLNPKNPKVSAAGRKLTIKKGKGKLKLVNKNSFAVQAKGSIVSQKRVAAKKKKVKFASFSASLAAKGKTVVKVKLSKANRKLLKKLGPTATKLTLKLTDGAGGKATAKQKITLVPKG